MEQAALTRLEQLLKQQAMAAACAWAEELLQRWEASGASAQAWDQLAFYLGRMHRHEQALKCYDEALLLAPTTASLHFNRAMVLRFLGKVDDAEAAVDRCLNLTPEDTEALALRSDLRKQTPARNHVAELKAMAARLQDPVGRVRVQYALAKELEDLGEYTAAFGALKAGADLRRARMQYDVAQDTAVMEKISTVYSAEFFARARAGCDNAEPIFVLGMPRVGSTLLERMLASHSKISSAGELDNFAINLVQQAKSVGRAADRASLVALTQHLDFSALGAAYVDSTRPLTGSHKHFIDKLPLNFLYVGLIAASLPNATIIHIHRNPMDSCFAMYKRLFHNAYPFSYALDELAKYYAAYQRLMSHWRQVLPGRMVEVAYEDLVDDAETTLADVLNRIGLPFEPACLEFHRNASASTTASASQVRQKVYRSSVEKWRHYEAELAPLRDALVREGVQI